MVAGISEGKRNLEAFGDLGRLGKQDFLGRDNIRIKASRHVRYARGTYPPIHPLAFMNVVSGDSERLHCCRSSNEKSRSAMRNLLFWSHSAYVISRLSARSLSKSRATRRVKARSITARLASSL